MPSVDNPMVIEVAVSPLRWGVPAQSAEEMARECIDSIDAGASVVHHHHDMRLCADDATGQLVDTGDRILRARPGALVYTDYLTGKAASDENAHLKPMREAGVLTMFAVDPGITTFGSFDDAGLPTRTYTDGLRFSEVHELVEFAKQIDVPLSLGVFEPGHLRWILAYNERVGFPVGSVVKLYFGGDWMVDRPGVRGINFGMPPTPAALDVYRDMLAGSGLAWIVSLFGGSLLDSSMARHAIESGGHLRVGVEDAAGETPLGNAELVARAVWLADEVGRRVATLGTARDVFAATGA